MQVENSCDDCLKNKNDLLNETPSSVQKCVNRLVKKQRYNTYKIDVKTTNTEGGNYLAVLYEIDIKGKTTDGEKEVNLFVKSAKCTEFLDSLVSINDVYTTEVYFYSELAKIFEDLQEKAKVPKEERYNLATVYEESDSEAIILENLAKKGFKTGFRMDVPSLEFLELSLKELAKFHAFSFIMQKKMPDYYKRKIMPTKILFNYDDHWKSAMERSMKNLARQFDSQIKKKIEDFMPETLERFPKSFHPKENSICCLCHGDYRINNILMHETEGVVDKVVPIDYQIIHYGCPLNDFIYLIYLGSDRRTRDLHMDHLKNVYCETMKQFLAYFDIDVEDVFPRKEFEHLLDSKKDHIMMLTTLYYPFLYVPESVVAEFGQEIFDKEFVIDPRGRLRLLELFDEFWGLKETTK